jgi:two-component system chemotaxis sensor kinase CheA
MDEIVQEFLVESHENLDALDTDLVALEQDPGSRDLLSSIFRTIHTIKGTSGFLAFSKLEGITHVGESLLSKLRDGALVLTPEVTSGLLLMVDVVRALLRSIEETGLEGDVDIAPQSPLSRPASRQRTATPPTQPTRAITDAQPVLPAVPPRPQPDITSTRLGDILGPVLCSVSRRRRGGGAPADGGATTAVSARSSWRLVPPRPDAISDALEHQHRRSIAESTVRVDVSVLDTLMRLVGELVLTRNQIAARTSDSDSALLRVLQRLSHVTAELQAGVMRTRMQPLDTVWNKFPRVVRDLSMACGKNVTLEMNGRETELDRTLLEAIKDPLTHIVRNAVDHGIETPEGAGPRASPRPAGCRCRRTTRAAAWSSRSPTTGTASTWPR